MRGREPSLLLFGRLDQTIFGYMKGTAIRNNSLKTCVLHALRGASSAMSWGLVRELTSCREVFSRRGPVS
jgi:hypothetical protein